MSDIGTMRIGEDVRNADRIIIRTASATDITSCARADIRHTVSGIRTHAAATRNSIGQATAMKGDAMIARRMRHAIRRQ